MHFYLLPFKHSTHNQQFSRRRSTKTRRLHCSLNLIIPQRPLLQQQAKISDCEGSLLVCVPINLFRRRVWSGGSHSSEIPFCYLKQTTWWSRCNGPSPFPVSFDLIISTEDSGFTTAQFATPPTATCIAAAAAAAHRKPESTVPSKSPPRPHLFCSRPRRIPPVCLGLPYSCKKINFDHSDDPAPLPSRIYSTNTDLLNMTELIECYPLWCVVSNCQRAQHAPFCIKCFTAPNNHVFLKTHRALVFCFIVFVTNWHFYGKYCVQRAETFTVSTMFRGLKHLR